MRRRYSVFAAALLLAVFFVPSPTHAQFEESNTDDLSDLRGALRSVSKGYARQYLEPVTDAFGANMNGGLFRTADVGEGFLPMLPFDVYLGVSMSGVRTASLNERFVPGSEPVDVDPPPTNPNAEAFVEFNPGTDQDVPTAFGDTDTPDASLDLVFRDENGNIATDPITGEPLTESLSAPPPGLIDIPVAPLPIPQIGIGSLKGTDVQFRFFPTTEVGGYGEVDLLGVALRHDLDQWINQLIPTPLPLEIAVQGAWNQFSLSAADSFTEGEEFEEVLDASGWSANLQVSRGVPVVPLLFYGGVQYESFDVDYSYTFQPVNSNLDPINVSLNQDAANSVRGIVGLSLTLTVVRFNIDYAVSTHDTVTAGLGIRL